MFYCSVFSVSEDVVTVTTPSDCRWLQVEFHTHTAHEEVEEKVMKIPAAGNTVSKHTRTVNTHTHINTLSHSICLCVRVFRC